MGLITAEEFARRAGLSPSTLRGYIHDRRALGRGTVPLPADYHGRTAMFDQDAATTWIANRAGQGARTDLWTWTWIKVELGTDGVLRATYHETGIPKADAQLAAVEDIATTADGREVLAKRSAGPADGTVITQNPTGMVAWALVDHGKDPAAGIEAWVDDFAATITHHGPRLIEPRPEP